MSPVRGSVRAVLVGTCLGVTACSTAGAIVGAAAVTGFGAASPGNEIDQTYYLGVLDPEEQLPPSLYRIRVRGQASAISSTRFASGWVPAEFADALNSEIAFDPTSKHLTFDTPTDVRSRADEKAVADAQQAVDDAMAKAAEAKTAADAAAKTLADVDKPLQPLRATAWKAAKKAMLDFGRGNEIRDRLSGSLKGFAEASDPAPETDAAKAVSDYLDAVKKFDDAQTAFDAAEKKRTLAGGEAFRAGKVALASYDPATKDAPFAGSTSNEAERRSIADTLGDDKDGLKEFADDSKAPSSKDGFKEKAQSFEGKFEAYKTEKTAADAAKAAREAPGKAAWTAAKKAHLAADTAVTADPLSKRDGIQAALDGELKPAEALSGDFVPEGVPFNPAQDVADYAAARKEYDDAAKRPEFVTATAEKKDKDDAVKKLKDAATPLFLVLTAAKDRRDKSTAAAVTIKQPFLAGRRLVLFGPEGFREAPANFRLVVVMGTSPEAYFAALGNTFKTITKIELAQANEGTDRQVATFLAELAERSRRLNELDAEAKTKLGS